MEVLYEKINSMLHLMESRYNINANKTHIINTHLIELTNKILCLISELNARMSYLFDLFLHLTKEKEKKTKVI